MKLDRFSLYEETKRRKLDEIDSFSSYAGVCTCAQKEDLPTKVHSTE